MSLPHILRAPFDPVSSPDLLFNANPDSSLLYFPEKEFCAPVLESFYRCLSYHVGTTICLFGLRASALSLLNCV
jgi:hypothetical protein